MVSTVLSKNRILIYLEALETVWLTTLDINDLISHSRQPIKMFVIASNAIKPKVCTFMCSSDEKCTAVIPTGCHIVSQLNASHCVIRDAHFFISPMVLGIVGSTFLQWIYLTPKNTFILSSHHLMFIICLFFI